MYPSWSLPISCKLDPDHSQKLDYLSRPVAISVMKLRGILCLPHISCMVFSCCKFLAHSEKHLNISLPIILPWNWTWADCLVRSKGNTQLSHQSSSSSFWGFTWIFLKLQVNPHFFTLNSVMECGLFLYPWAACIHTSTTTWSPQDYRIPPSSNSPSNYHLLLHSEVL